MAKKTKQYVPTIEKINPDGDCEKYLIKAGVVEILLNANDSNGNLELYKNGNLVYMEDIELGSDRKVSIRDKNGNSITLIDDTDDGVFDKLSYDVTDSKGDWVATAIDENLNGEIDRIHKSKEPKCVVRYEGKLYEVIESGKDKYGYVINQVNVDGELKRIYFDNHPYRIEIE